MRRPLILILLCLLLCGFTKVPQRQPLRHATREELHLLHPDTLSALWHYTDGVAKLVAYGDTTAARASLRRALAVDSTYAPAQYMTARLLTDSAPAEALTLARKAYEADTTNIAYLEAYATAEVYAGNADAAIDRYRTLARKSNDPACFNMLAYLYNATDRPAEALAALDSIEVHAGRNVALLNMRQGLLLRTEQYGLAASNAQQIIADAPYLPDGYVCLGDTYARMGSDSLAVANYTKAMEVAPESIVPVASLAEYYASRNNYLAYFSVLDRMFGMPAMAVGRKIETFRKLTSLGTQFYKDFYPQINALANKLIINYPDNREVIGVYTDHLLATGDVEQALKIYKQNLRPDSAPDDYTRIIGIEHYLQHPDSVQHYLAQALQCFPANADMRMQEGHLRLAEGRYAEAVAAYRKAFRCATDDKARSVAMGCIGDAEHLRGDMRRCYEAFVKALHYDADNSSVLNNYAYFLSLEGRDLERALAMATRATALSPSNPTFIDTQAWVLYRLGRYAEAKKLMQQALSLDRNASAEMALHYGDILYALGEKFMAQTYWRKALERGADAAKIEERLGGKFNPAATEQKGKTR